LNNPPFSGFYKVRQIIVSFTNIAKANWNRTYSIRDAVFPIPSVTANRFWATVNRIDDVYGDRNLVCSCPPIETYID
jgi:glycine dehydrogenase